MSVGIGLALACLAWNSLPAQAGSRLFAPLVRGHADAATSLAVTDRSGRGSLVDLYLRHASGEPLRYGRHPVTITRAIPPGETMTIALADYVAADFDGSLEISASDDVVAVLDMPEIRYDLVSPVRGADVAIAGRTSSDVRVATCGTGERTVVDFAYRIDSDPEVLTIGAFAAARRRWRVPPKVDWLRWEATAPAATVVWQSAADGPGFVFPSR